MRADQTQSNQPHPSVSVYTIMAESPSASSSDVVAAGAAASSSSPAHIEYSSEAELLTEFRKFMRDPSNLEIATNHLYNSLLDETILGVAYEMHFTLKTGLFEALEGIPEDNKPFSIVDMPDIDIFGASSAKIAMVCTCPKCFQGVSASRFAPHMEKCMGKCMGRAPLLFVVRLCVLAI